MTLLLIVLLDQIIKFFAIRWHFAAINKGVAFGLFSFVGSNFFLFFICLFLIFYCLSFISSPRSKTILPLKLILIGGFSNLLDRIFYGGVVDYLHLPLILAFNLADLVINIGFILFLKNLFFKNDRFSV